MFDKWQAPDRDSPSIELEYQVKMTDQLRALLGMEGVDGYREDAVKLRTGQELSRPRRWHLMFERMGLLYRINDQTHLTDLGKELLRLSSAEPKLELAKKSLVTLSRYQLKNPIDEEGDIYPEDCDIHPYWAIWKACDELDGKLHWDELNRELMRVFRHADLDAVIKKIRIARSQPGYNPANGGTTAVPLSERCYDNETPPEGRTGEGQVRDQRTTPWFKRASLGEYLLSSPGAQGNGYWSIRPEFQELIHDWVSKGPPLFRSFGSKEEWYRYLSGQSVIVQGRPLNELMTTISADIVPAGLQFEPRILLRFMASILSKRLLLLTGLAGSGKTKLAQAFALWITPNPEGEVDGSKSYAMVPVGADWTGNENVLGYPDGLRPPKLNADGSVGEPGSYITKPTLDLILHAIDNPDIPHFLILDEMNLSHVERYFADILSAIESEETIQLHHDAARKSNCRDVPTEVDLPKNLFIIGTVNVDETTYMFSPKVLDRANVIEFRMDAKELEGFLSNPTKPDLSKLAGKGKPFDKAFVDAAKGLVDLPGDVKADYEAEMLLFFNALRGHGVEFGFRVAHEAARFIHFYKLFGNYSDGDAPWFPGAFDCVVLQKFLPKLHGSRAKLGPLLKKLWFLCIHDPAERGSDPLKSAEEAARSSGNLDEPSSKVPAGAPYPLSAEKIGRMWRLLNENGFASFAEA